MTEIAMLDKLIADLTHDAELTAERLRLARELRSTFDAPVLELEAAPEAPPPRPPKDRPARDEQIACPDCGRMCGSPQGLAAHRRNAHPESAAKPVPPLRSVDLDPDKVLRCGECGHECATETSLSDHTFGHHRRPPKIAERVPVDPKAAA